MAKRLEMNVGLVRSLARFLSDLPRRKFDYAVVVDQKKEGDGDYPSLKRGCGTVACAMGWTPAVPALRRLGVKWIGTGWMVSVRYRRAEDFEAMEKLFHVSKSVAALMFGPGYDLGGLVAPGNKATPKRVSKHLLKVVDAYKAGKLDEWCVKGAV